MVFGQWSGPLRCNDPLNRAKRVRRFASTCFQECRPVFSLQADPAPKSHRLFVTARRDIQLIDCARLAPVNLASGRWSPKGSPAGCTCRTAIRLRAVGDCACRKSHPGSERGRSAARAPVPADAHPGWSEGEPAQRFCPGFNSGFERIVDHPRVCSASFPGWRVYLALCRVPDYAESCR